MTNEHLPPAPDLKALILAEHRRAELQRLEEGQAGCGCSDCQLFYQTIDLSKYGRRVKTLDGYVLIVEKARQAADSDTVQTDCLPLPDKQGRVTKLPSDSLIPLPVMAQPVKPVNITGNALKHGGGRPQKPAGAPISRRTLYRRQKQGAVL